MATTHKRRLRDPAPSSVESFQSGVIVPARWAHDADQQAALASANGVDLVQERVTAVVVIGALLLLVLGVARMSSS